MYASSGKQLDTGTHSAAALVGFTIVHALSAVANCSAVRSRADAHAFAVFKHVLSVRRAGRWCALLVSSSLIGRDADSLD